MKSATQKLTVLYMEIEIQVTILTLSMRVAKILSSIIRPYQDERIISS
jgi:hypothetical protein